MASSSSSTANLAILFLLTWLENASSSSSLYNFSIAKPNCKSSCGDVSIPFPFGTTDECSENANYFINCNKSYDPPKPFLQTSNAEITNITLDGQLTLLQQTSHQCYFQNGTMASNRRAFLNFPVPFIVNTTANKFTVVGCDTYGSVKGRRLRRNYTTGCTSTCNSKDDMIQGSCTGIGCCQIPIPKDTWWVDLGLKSYNSHGSVWEFNNCSYAFLAKEDAFSFSADNLTSLKDVRLLPIVVDWAMGNRTCEEGKKDGWSYACRSNHSECYDRNNGYGYRCSCLEGYEGNPYLSHGCIDINECEEELHNCEKKEYCENTPGNFSCICPEGYHGNGISGCFHGDSPVYKLVAGIAVGVILLMLAACWLHWELKRRRLIQIRQMFYLQNGGNLLKKELAQRKESSDFSPKLFTEAELQRATNSFHRSMVIGQGGYGTVYKGSLPDNRTIAIKRSKQVDPKLVDPKQVEQFVNEVIIFSRINHRNVVKFLGCCVETPVPLLVYDFMINGTLFEHVHDKAKSCSLTWAIRLRVAAETAGLVSYLHSQASTPIIHRDVKSANILLDHTFTAKVSDFGASRLVPMDQSQLSTVVQGTLGYLDPEYMQTSQLTEKSDVYSFGVVLLELLTGMKALSYERPANEQNLACLFLSVMKEDRLIQILDDNVVYEANKDQVLKVALLAKNCLHVRGDDRPCMKTVAVTLEGLILEGNQNRDIDNEEGNSSSLAFEFDSVQSNVVPDENEGR